MKTKMLATALTVSIPLIFGAAYAQTTTSESGQNRSASGNAATSNPPASAGGPTAAPGTAPDPASGATTSRGSSASGAASTSDAAGTARDSGSMGATGTPGTTGAATPATGMSSDAAASTEAITGWSAKDDIIGKSVHNENDEKVGDINDIVISSDGRSLYVLIGAGGFLGLGEKHVAVPFDRLQRSDDRILLSGYTKEQLKNLPEVRTGR